MSYSILKAHCQQPITKWTCLGRKQSIESGPSLRASLDRSALGGTEVSEYLRGVADPDTNRAAVRQFLMSLTLQTRLRNVRSERHKLLRPLQRGYNMVRTSCDWVSLI